MSDEQHPKRPTALSRRRFIAGTAFALAGLSTGSSDVRADPTAEVSQTSAAIHQERSFAATRRRVYDVLTIATQFDHVVRLSEAMQSGMKLGTSPTAIHNQPGGVFTLFGGHISGRFIELVPHQRIVQAWRVATWEPGQYSIARYELSDEGSGAKLVFDHTGFPSDEADHLAQGWNSNYWVPLAKSLAQGEQPRK
jgi:activator of HSP90 ATPase